MWRRWLLALSILTAAGYFASLVYVAWAATATTVITATMAREVIADGGGSSTENYITSQTTVEYAWPAGTNWSAMQTVTIANGTGAFLYLKFWNSATTGTVSNTDFHLGLKTSETLVVSRYNELRDLLPIQTIGVYQRQLAVDALDPSSFTLQIHGYR